MNKAIVILTAGLVVAARAEPTKLSLPEAETRAIQQHPKVNAAELSALIAREEVIEARSSLLPSITANATAVGALDPNNTRITAGYFNNPSIFQRNAEGLAVNQLITDFGRSWNLSQSSKLHFRAEEKGALATTGQIVTQLDTAYLRVLEAQAVEKVATQTVETRQLLFDRISTLATNLIKSDLDVSFARVGLEDGRLLLAQASRDLAAAHATLAWFLGEKGNGDYVLEEQSIPTDLSAEPSDLVQEALKKRPEILQARYEVEAAQRFANAEHELNYPTISAFGTAGITPIHDSHLKGDYEAAGVNFSLPLFNGGLYTSRARAATLQAKKSEDHLLDLENEIIRDVRIAWQNVSYARKKLDETKVLLASANQALALANARYVVGAGSIVEVSQAQLNATSAQIQDASAGYEYLIVRAILEYQIGHVPWTTNPKTESTSHPSFRSNY